MSNFAFVRQALPALAEDCAQAERYLAADPRAACIYARRAAEIAVNYLYDVLDLDIPYRDDLAARISDGAFVERIPQGIRQKLTMIRRIGNSAVHEEKPIRPAIAAASLRELFHLAIWVCYHHTAHPEAVPLTAQFNPTLARTAAPLTREQTTQLAARFEAEAAAHASALAAKDEEIAARDAELATLRAQIAAAQAAAKPDTRDYTEAETRDRLIDVALREAGWALDQPRDREYPVTGMPNADGRGFVDYVLWGADGLPLAVVEAKRTSVSPEVGQQQAKLYADCLEREFGRRPIIFYTNGDQHRIWDDAAGYPPRDIQGFYTADELELAIQRRTTKRPLSGSVIDTAIAGRPYQVRAIKTVGETFDRKARAALLVMATGSGKTRTTIALVDVLQKANWVKRVLFLADRTALVTQAARAFTMHLPASTTVNLLTEKATEARVYVSTYPTMMNLINDLDGGRRRFGPGYFDLIVIDEAHRSVYAKYGAIFDYFDALLVGLTATPKDEVDHNTYRLFHLEDGVPTDYYSLDEAVADGYLVPPKAVSVGTQFLRSGIRYDDLTEAEREQWDLIDWGEDGAPDEVGAEELNRFLFNEDTVDKVLETLMTRGHRVAGGDRIGKTIIFAKNQRHADFIKERFDRAYPELGGRAAAVITHAVRYSQDLIDSFSDPAKTPDIAISVDMLDTGLDVPDVVNLVFFKTVRSKTKFWQMIGRGTRLRPDLVGPGVDKQDFYVFDFCGNLEYFSQDLPNAQGQTQSGLSERLFNARVELLGALGESALRGSVVNTLLQIVAGMNPVNFVVRPHRAAVEKYAAAEAWHHLSPADQESLSTLAGLPSAVRDGDENAKRFDLVILRGQLAALRSGAMAPMRETIQQVASALLAKTTIPAVAAQAVLLEAVAGDEWWADVTVEMLELARTKIRGLAGLIDRRSQNPIYTDFADVLGEAVEIELPTASPGINRDRFTAKAEAYLRRHLDAISLQRLRRNRQLTGDDLTELERMLRDAGGASADIAWASEQAGGLGIFVRRLVGLDRGAATEAFARYLDGSAFTADQVRFIGLIVEELTGSGVMSPSRLFESPYIDHAPTGPDYLFPDADVTDIVDTLTGIHRTALPQEVA